jgi:hypothetical protein
MTKSELVRGDILPLDEYKAVREKMRADLITRKKNRRLAVGPHATFYFENYATMWFQVHEMLLIEKGGDEQIKDELAAYNPLIPKGHELVATVMFEIDDPILRRAVLGQLGGVEETMELRFAGQVIKGKPEADLDRTNAAGKASSVQFVHFPFTAAQIMAFKAPAAEVIVSITHANYGHMAVVPEAMRKELAGDFF